MRRVRFPVRFDAHLLPKPFSAFLGNSGLGQLVAELQLEIVARETISHAAGSDVELSLKITLLLDVGRRSEDEPHFLDTGKFFFECFVSVNRKVGRDDGEFRPWAQPWAKLVNHAPLLLIVQYLRRLHFYIPPCSADGGRYTIGFLP
ncbi:hypothetical protein, partial [uncultured Selenomonas sp.]|uniref:hypothetical protein n=1 Tax=uncultured Selenomonas sp. TaxID=159275 RepID=UPI0028DB97D9